MCAIDRCEQGFGDCDGSASNGCETRLDTAMNCGACASRCEGSTPVCDPTTRTCGTGCSGAQSNCSGSCVDTQTDAAHCGACGRQCSLPNAVAGCAAGACTITRCADGFGDCNANPADGCETPLGTSANCGRCGDSCSGATPVCDGATRACASGCSDGSSRCGMLCIDTRINAAHCGACNRACMLASATARCAMGACLIDVCAAGFLDCDSTAANGCEVNARSSLLHCGGCNRRCDPPNAVETCANGICTYSMCDAGYGDCDGNPTNGCEIDTRSSLLHCGGCGRVCNPSNATPSCAGGVCGYSACAPGYADCDGNRANGCEVDTRSSPAHCGVCRRSCARNNATTACRSSMCALVSCDPSFENCDANEANGCEVSLRDDVAHCGACGNRCPTRTNATSTCAGGACSFVCAPAFGDCNAMDGDGCEQSLRDVAHCGACGRACNLPHATPACPAGTCTIASCEMGFGNCDTMAANGCEVDFATNANHCGRCGTRCTSGQTCVRGVCSP